MRFVIFFSIFTAVLGLAHYYVGRRMISGTGSTPSRKRIIWSLVTVSFLLCVLALVTRLFLIGHPIAEVFAWVGNTALGLFSIVAILTIGRDLVLLVTKFVGRIVGFAQKLSGAPAGSALQRKPDSDRRKVLIAGSNLALIGVSGVLTGYGVYEARRTPRIREIEIPMPNLPSAFDGFRIVQISDIHVGPTIHRDWVEMVVGTASDAGADMAVFTGDFVDGTVPNLREHTAPIRDLTGRFGQFFVTGNHEYYSGVMPWLDEIDRLGWNILMNEHRVIEKDGARLVIAGVTDYRAGGFYPEHQSDPYAAISGAPSDAPRILLAHQPASVIEASNAGFDVQICGHTHGGQFFPWDNLARLAQPYISGLHRHDNKMWIYVSRGTGYWGPPVRIGQPSEITLVTLKRAPIPEAV